MTTQKYFGKAQQPCKISTQKMWHKALNYSGRNLQALFYNPGLFVVRKFARIETFRHVLLLVSRLTKPQPKISVAPSNLTGNKRIEEVVASIEKCGYFAGLQLPQSVVQQILEYAETGVCAGDRDPNLKFPYNQKEQIEAKYNRKFLCCSYPAEDSSAIMQLAHDETLQAIAAYYLKAKPVYVSGELLWSFSVDTTQTQKLNMAQVFHYDLDDLRSIKFFFYLNDVNSTNGAHVCIQGSHQGKKFLHQLLGQRCASIPDEKIMHDYGLQNVVAFSGQAGFGFAEDPSCFHKGASPVAGKRLLLQLQFSMHDYKDIRAYKI